MPGLPEGSAYTAEVVMDSIARGVASRLPELGTSYVAFVDLSGGSNDDACLAVAHLDADKRVVVDRVLNQGPQPPFDPELAVERFASVLAEYGVDRVVALAADPLTKPGRRFADRIDPGLPAGDGDPRHAQLVGELGLCELEADANPAYLGAGHESKRLRGDTARWQARAPPTRAAGAGAAPKAR